RKADDPSLPIGPAWVTSVLLDLTALGGPTVITLVVLAVVGFLLLQTRYWTAFFITITAISGEAVSYAMKTVFARPRPTVVPHPRRTAAGHRVFSAIAAARHCYARHTRTHDVMTEATLETILLVEDEPAVRQLFAQALTRVGYFVYEARNGQEAMKLFDQHGDSIDMLLTDMRMP